MQNEAQNFCSFWTLQKSLKNLIRSNCDIIGATQDELIFQNLNSMNNLNYTKMAVRTDLEFS